MRRTHAITILLFVALVIGSALYVRPVRAATIIVGNPGDGAGDCTAPATCTLRQALSDAVAGDIIEIEIDPINGPLTITLDSPLQVTTDNITISGQGATLQPATAGIAAALDITASDSTVQGLTITGFDTGVLIDGSAGGGDNNNIGLPVGDGRVVLLNNGDGLVIRDGATNNLVRNTIIGLDLPQTLAGSTRYGIWINNADDNTIGGAGNAQAVVAASGSHGIYIDNSDNVTVDSSAIGLSLNGQIILQFPAGNILDTGNGNHGVLVSDAANVRLTNNYSGLNDGNGFRLQDANNATVTGNFIGVPAFLIQGAGNGLDGIFAARSDGTLSNNTISNNGRAGIYVASGNGMTLSNNTIDENNGLGIDLAPPGVTLNDGGDPDGGPNRLQNFPRLTNAASDGTDLQLIGNLASRANRSYELEFFVVNSCDPSDFGEGLATGLTLNVNTNGNGRAPFDNIFAGAGLAVGQFITATATDTATGDTSEFSRCIEIAPSNIVADFIAVPTTGTAPLTVDFTNLSTGFITGYQWDFGDGNTSTATNPRHTYTAPGTYTVTLTVFGQGGPQQATETIVVTGDEELPLDPTATPPDIPPPPATFTATPQPAATLTETITPTETPEPTATLTPTVTVSPTASETLEPTATFTREPLVALTVVKDSDGDDEMAIDIINVGDDLEDVTVIEELRDEVRYIASRPGAPVCLEQGGIVACQLSDVPADEITSIEITVDSQGADPASGQTTVIVGGVVQTTIDEPYILKIGDPPVAGPGDAVTYTVRIINPTDETAEALVVTDTMPDALDILSAEATSGQVTVEGQDIRFTQATLAPGERITITIEAVVRDDALLNQIINEACLSSSSNASPRCAQMSFLRVATLPSTGETPFIVRIAQIAGLGVVILGSGWLLRRRYRSGH